MVALAAPETAVCPRFGPLSLAHRHFFDLSCSLTAPLTWIFRIIPQLAMPRAAFLHIQKQSDLLEAWAKHS
jgi:hypothetical protein